MKSACKIIGYKNLLFCNGVRDYVVEYDSIKDKNELCCDGISNRPFDEGQLGCVFELDSVIFNREAVDILKNIKKSRDDIGEVDIYSNKGKFYLAWLGSPVTIIGSDAEGSRNYDISPLGRVTVIDCEIPQSIVDYCIDEG